MNEYIRNERIKTTKQYKCMLMLRRGKFTRKRRAKYTQYAIEKLLRSLCGVCILLFPICFLLLFFVFNRIVT